MHACVCVCVCVCVKEEQEEQVEAEEKEKSSPEASVDGPRVAVKGHAHLITLVRAVCVTAVVHLDVQGGKLVEIIRGNTKEGVSEEDE